MADTPKPEDKGKHARYLAEPEHGHVELVPKEDVEDKLKSGWTEPTGTRPNGYEYNREEDQLQIDAAGEALSARRKWQADQDAEKEKEREKIADDAKKAQEKADADAKPKPAPAVPVNPTVAS